MRRVVVTGMGLLTPLGSGVDYNWRSLIEGKSGIRQIDNFDISQMPSKIAGFVPRGEAEGEFNPDDIIDAKEQRRLSDFIIYAIKAADEAIKDSGFDLNDEDLMNRSGVIIGSGIGGLGTINNNSIILKEKGVRRVSPFFIPSSLINLASGHVSIKYGLTGPNHSVVTACATGTHSIGDASRIIKYGDADIMVCGGSEAAIDPVGLAGFSAAKALSTQYNDTPELASRPWDKGRDGFVMGEGAGILVLEEYEHAKKRGAKIYAEISGYGMSGDSYHITSPHPEGKGAYNAMKNALNDAQLSTTDINYINAHGTSTPVGDQAELSTVTRLFEKRSNDLSMSSTKSSIGHLLGAAGSVEAIYSILAINNNVRPATLNLVDQIDDAEIDLIAQSPQERKTDIVLSNSFGFGGTNASLIIKRI